MKKYNPQEIESKWQKKWEKEEIYKAEDRSKKSKKYILLEFPYPSGAGLHVGHCRSYSALDAIARKKRMEGYNVLFPIGWDAFGLPTENYAIKHGIHPKAATAQNIKNFRRQIESLGLSFDWSREINTTDPVYYKWTQWIFLKLFEKRLAYQAEMPINWCPSCKIGLANEEVVDGKCERCGTLVEKKIRKQWMLKITAYADRLIKDLEKVDYPERVKTQQINWIGRSCGTEVKFKLNAKTPNAKDYLNVFTTRPDTLFGCTYLVVAPEHEVIRDQETGIRNYEEVKSYIKKATKKSDLERTELVKEKTGVELKGIKAINPVNNEEIPIFVADYVLPHYGTGAIMAVPAHDERDFEFAKKYKIDIRRVIIPNNDLKSFFMQGSFNGDVEKELKKNNLNYAINNKGGFYITLKLSDLDNYIRIIKKHLKKEFWCEVIGTKTIFIYDDGEIIDVANERDAIKALKKCKEFYEPMNVHYNLWEMLWNCEFYHDILCFTEDGININSDFLDGLKTEKAKEKIIKWLEEKEVGKRAVNYKLRDWIFSRQHYWGEPIPLVHCEKCGTVPIPEKDLPVELPYVEKYEPTKTGKSPLANISGWVNVKCPKCGGKAKRETDTMPNWAGSSWYFMRYIDPGNNKELASKEKLKYWMPVDWYNGGMEHTTLHLLYSRFWYKFLFDIGIAPQDEPYQKRTSHGIVLAEDGRKMSKSFGNVINPDNVVQKYGADTLRIYEMFMGPFDQAIAWSEDGVKGVYRFLEKVWKLALEGGKNKKSDPAVIKAIHKLNKKIDEDLEATKFNTLIASFMEFVNFGLENKEKIGKDIIGKMLILLAPFAPHLSEELWSSFAPAFAKDSAFGSTKSAFGQTKSAGRKASEDKQYQESIFRQKWPKCDPKLIREETFNLIIQINGKFRDKVKTQINISQAEAEKISLKQEKIKKWTEGKEIKKIIFVPKKLINMVTNP